ncbi:MAG: acyltransferase [Staphylococcus sp.]|nr:acyltransferase [Staphylococcus sp.]
MKEKSSRNILQALKRRFSLSKLEMLCASHWVNPFATLYLNLRSFPLRQAVKCPVIVYGRPKFYSLAGSMKIEGAMVRCGMVKFNKTIPGAPSFMGLQSEIVNNGSIVFHGPGFVGCGTKISVGSSGKLVFGAEFKITDCVNIGCLRRIVIGNVVRIVHRCQILDSNYHYIANFAKGTIADYNGDIHIGDNCWICNSTTVTGGAVIPDYTIVGSNSLVNRDFSSVAPHSLLGGIPAKHIMTGLSRVENQSLVDALDRYYSSGNLTGAYKIPENLSPELCWSRDRDFRE